ncbi:GNAT family N-acetyltransferase [Frondihabitans sp. VKM Ac-2883]|uniref:GNAT family N-acetyltransferase n=1 Tax=Frondihabitans sp. VKM Ac-2883 TaxID=2783823 RepID=UPI00188A3222|nr:GNAT family N-acetyltransferase [Frondihabitans sp. VKM Ac-2883]MBF4575167.1 GNAT family N-acetyltransferase [Frondihabitans sp. VKM Ac-2883]
MTQTETVLFGSCRHDELVESGFLPVGESWGARLEVSPSVLSLCRQIVFGAEASGFECGELGRSDLRDVVHLESLVAGDYPSTPATVHEVPSLRELEALSDRGVRSFGLRHEGSLVAVTLVGLAADRAETEFTSVHPEYRRQGLSKAVKASSILALALEGVALFGTGGAAVNEASIRMNESLGYCITEPWVSLER